jgi:hypothetical protein
LQQPAANLFAFYQKENALLVCFYLKFYLVGNTGARVKRSLGVWPYGLESWQAEMLGCATAAGCLLPSFPKFRLL